MYLGKIFYYMSSIISRKASDSKVTTSDLKKEILEVYDLVDPTDDKRQVESIRKKLKQTNDKKLRQMLINEEIKFNYMAVPFSTPDFESIETAAEILDIPLAEKVYIPEKDTWTKEPVSVGIMQLGAMEQLSEDQESTRATAGYDPITGQPQKGKKREGGQAIGEQDLRYLSTYSNESSPVIKELMVARSDNVKNNRKLINNLRQNGKTEIPKDESKGQSREFFQVLMNGLGLDID